MNYFGVEKKVAVFNKVYPRDFDRSKMFKLEVPVTVCYYKVVFGFDSGSCSYIWAIRKILITESKKYTLDRDIYGNMIGSAVLSGNSLEHLSKFVTIMSKDLI